MNEMIERVARALHGCGWNDPAWDALDESAKALHFALARAAIAAMREPTYDMVERGQGMLDCTPINRCHEQARKVWAGMIWVAANGPEET